MKARLGRGRRGLPARRRAVAVTIAVALGASTSSALDANRVHTFVLGRGTAFAAAEGLNASNDNRAPLRLPGHVALTLRARIPGGIGQAPVSDEAGALFIVHGEPRLSKLDAKARIQWSQRLPSEASCSPVLLSGGSLLVLTRNAQALLVLADGRPQRTVTLDLADPRKRTVAIPTANGGALLASGRDLIQLDANAEILRQSRLGSSVSSLAEAGSDAIAILENGTVEVAHAAGDFERVGSFSGTVPDGAAVDGRQVVALVDSHKLQRLDRVSGALLTLVEEPSVGLSGPLALLGAGGSAWVIEGGFVSVRNRSGAEILRVPVGMPGQTSDPALRGVPPARLIADDAGAIAAVRGGTDAVVVSANGAIERLDGTACLEPFRPTPTRSGLVLSCRSGQLFVVGGSAPTTNTP